MNGCILIGAMDVLDERGIFHQEVIDSIGNTMPFLHFLDKVIRVGRAGLLHLVQIRLIGIKRVVRCFEVQLVLIRA